MGPILSSSPGCLMMGRSASPKAVPPGSSTGWQQSPLVGVAQPKGRFEWTCHCLHCLRRKKESFVRFHEWILGEKRPLDLRQTIAYVE